MVEKLDRLGKYVLWLVSLSFLVVLLSTGYIFLVRKDYNFYLEAYCNPETTTCFTRDCSEPDSCPPNNLEDYRVFYVKAKDFNKCSDNSCLTECSSGQISCEEVVCGEEPSDECSLFVEPSKIEDIPVSF